MSTSILHRPRAKASHPGLPVYLTATAAEAYSGIDQRRIIRDLDADAWLRTKSGQKQFGLWATASVDAFADAHPDYVTLPHQAEVA